MDFDIIAAPFEFKFEGNGLGVGEFTGYGAVFGNQDSHGDVIAPGAFKDSIAERKSQGRNLPMHVMHAYYGGDGLPVGKWISAEEDDKGLKVHGKISGMNTDAGKLNYERLKDGAFGGLSIGFSVPPGGAVEGKEPGDPKRTLKAIRLHEISLVDEPSNALARVDQMKSRFMTPAEMRQRLWGDFKAITSTPSSEKAAQSLAALIALHQACMTGGDSPNAEERDQLLAHAQDAHEALTGARMPSGVKAIPETIRGREAALRAIGFSRSQAEQLADLSMKLRPRDEVASEKAANEAKAAAEKLRNALSFLS